MIRFVILPPAQKFSLTYNSSKGYKCYRVSAPIEITEEGFTAYAFNKGIRTFKFDKIVNLEPILAK